MFVERVNERIIVGRVVIGNRGLEFCYFFREVCVLEVVVR